MIQRIAVLSLLALAGAVGTAAGQESRSLLQEFHFDASREELRQRLDSLRTVLEGAERSDRSEGQLASVRREAQRVQSRLENGDLRPGDAIEVDVPADGSVTGTYQVTAQRTLDLPAAGIVDVGDLLYSEVPDRVSQAVRSVVRAERIDVQPLIRVAVLGQVSNPGYYDLAPSSTVSDAIMAAGGPTQSAEVQKARLRRPEQRGGEDEGTRIPSLTGRSLIALGVTRGDEVYIPASSGFPLRTVATVFGLVSSITFAATRIF